MWVLYRKINIHQPIKNHFFSPSTKQLFIKIMLFLGLRCSSNYSVPSFVILNIVFDSLLATFSSFFPFFIVELLMMLFKFLGIHYNLFCSISFIRQRSQVFYICNYTNCIHKCFMCHLSEGNYYISLTFVAILLTVFKCQYCCMYDENDRIYLAIIIQSKCKIHVG